MTAVPSSASSSAETAKEIKTLLHQLNKSKKKRKKKHISNNSDVRELNKEDAIRLDKLRKIFGELITRNEFTLSSSGGSSLTATSTNISNNVIAFVFCLRVAALALFFYVV